jgi:hypothetical protein
MPSLDYSFLQKLQDDVSKYTCFIETGTLNGDTTFAMEPYFEKLYTIEFSEKYYIKTMSRYLGNKIYFMLGDSGIVFEYLLPKISEKSVFFLDGHWSSGDTGRSAKDCPLVEEITHINNLFKNEAIIIIDDYRLFGLSPKTGSNEDWSDINKDKLLNILGSRINKTYHLDSASDKNDRLIIHINSVI